MKYEQPYKGRATINDNGYELEVIVPAYKQIFITLFMLAWLGGWGVGWVMVVSVLLPESTEAGLGFSAFILFWLFGWTLGGGFVIYKVAWNLFGKEVLKISTDYVKISKRVLRISRSKHYMISDVKNFRSNNLPEKNFWGKWFGTGYWNTEPRLAFDYGMKTVKFASGIDEAEARHILEHINRILPG